MSEQPSAQDILWRLVAAAWEPEGGHWPESIPWSEVLDLAESANLAALLYAVSRGKPMPAEVEEALEQAHYRVAAENARCLRQWAEVGVALSKVGASPLLLKGAALAETLYDGLAVRPIGDLDLAVCEEQVPACRQALVELGYRPADVEHRRGTQRGLRNEEVFEPPPSLPAWVELHWHLLDVPYYLRHVPMAWFWENSEAQTVAGQPCRVLTPEANLVYLPAHLALHHRFRRLHSFVDMALLIARHHEQLDWERIGSAARSFELLTALRETLHRLAAYWPALPLDEPRRRMGALEPTRNDARLFRLLTAESRTVTLDFYITLASLPDARSRARFAWLNLFPQPSYMRARYRPKADWQLPFWYGYRLAGGLARFARMLPGARRLDRPLP